MPIDDIRLKMDRERIEADLKAMRDEMAGYAEQQRIIFDLKDRLDVLGNQKEELQISIKKLIAAKAKTDDEFYVLQRKRAETVSEIAAMDERLGGLAEVESNVQKRIEEFDKQLKDKKSKQAELEIAIASARQDQRRILERTVDAQKELDKVESILPEVREELDKLQKRKTQLLKETVTAHGELTRFIEQREVLLNEVKRLEREKENIIEAKKEEKNRKEIYCAEWEERLKTREHEFAETQEKLSVKERQLGEKVILLRKAKENIELATGKTVDVVI